MASTPGFNPNDYRKANPDGFRNRPVSDAYEPGSTIKSLTAGRGHRQGAVQALSRGSICLRR